MAHRYDDFLEAGTRLVAIDIDTPGQHAAMIEKLDLPFPYLSDPDRSLAIEPFGVADARDPREIARPAIVLIGPDGEEAWRWESRDYADRIDEEAVVNAARSLGLGPVDAERPEPGEPAPGPKAVSMPTLPAYFRGARFAVVAMRRRHESIRADGLAFIEEMDRYLAVLAERKPR